MPSHWLRRWRQQLWELLGRIGLIWLMVFWCSYPIQGGLLYLPTLGIYRGYKSRRQLVCTSQPMVNCWFGLVVSDSRGYTQVTIPFIRGFQESKPPTQSSKYLVTRCLEPLKAFSGGVCGSKHLSSQGIWKTRVYLPLGILAHLLRMAMEPKYLAQEVIVHPNHPLTR